MEMCVYIYPYQILIHRWNILERNFALSIDGILNIYIYFHRWNFPFVISDVSTDGNWLFNLMHVYAVSIIARLQRPFIFLCTLLVL